MVAGAWLQLDLLARRREQLGLARPQPLPVRQLLIRGAVIGGVLPLLFLLAGLFLLLQDRLLAAQEEQLAPSAFAYDGLQQRMQELLVQIDTAKTTNRSIAEAMADVRSSSAVLGELKQILPSEMVLDEVNTGGNQLALKGAALQPDGLRTINAFLLRLARSSLFDAQQVRLEKAEVRSGSSGVASKMSFSLVADFREDSAAATRPRLEALGAVGLAKRVRLLQAEKLLAP